EDGIRDDLVTGVQTCALPISQIAAPERASTARAANHSQRSGTVRCGWAAFTVGIVSALLGRGGGRVSPRATSGDEAIVNDHSKEIGRASCRERVERAGGGGTS